MQLHNLKPKTNFRKSRRIGQGGKRGTYSGRGIKGQRARAGAKFRPALREILKKIPKLRGYKFKAYREEPAAVNLRTIELKMKSGDTISPESLWRAGLITKTNGKLPKVKILGAGDLKKKFSFKDVTFSKSAALKIK